MLTREKIINFIWHEQRTFRNLPDTCVIIGSAGLLLSGLLIPHVSDIDILTSQRNYETLKDEWKKYIHTNDHPDNGKKFESHFFRLNCEGTIVEVMAELFVNTNDIWKKVEVTNCNSLIVDDITLYYPTLTESIRLLKLFNRDKDKQKLQLIEHTLKA
jgi:uncharacterized UPF0160 family protein